MEINAKTVDFNQNVEMKKDVNAQSQKVDLSVPEDKVELKSKSKTKTGAKIGAFTGVGLAAYRYAGPCRSILKDVYNSIATYGNKKIAGVTVALGAILGTGLVSGIGAGIGALAGKIADCFSSKSDK